METDPVYLYRTGKLILYFPHAEHKGLSKQESYDRSFLYNSSIGNSKKEG